MVQPTLGGLARIVYRRKWAALLFAVVVIALGVTYLVRAVPVYRSDASLVVRFGRSALPVTNLARDSTPFVVDQNDRREMIQANADILTSPDVAQVAIEKFGLERLYPAIAAGTPKVGTRMNEAVKRFLGDLFVSPELAGDVIRLAFTHTDPVVARDMLDTLIDVYMQRESEIFASSSYDFQKSQAELASKRLTAAQKELTTYKVSSGISDFDTQLGAMIKQGSELSERLAKAQVTLAENTQRRDALTALLATVPATISNSSGEKYRQVDDAQSRVNLLRLQEREMIASHGPDWPALRALRASIQEALASTSTMSAASAGRNDTRSSEVYQNIQLDLLRAKANAESGEQAVGLMVQQRGALAEQIHRLEAVRAGLTERQREVDLADNTYRSIALHLEDSRIGNDRLRDGLSSVAIITQPNLPYMIAKPRYRMIGIATAAAALIGALFVAFALEFFDDRLNTADQVTARLKVPVLATFDKT